MKIIEADESTNISRNATSRLRLSLASLEDYVLWLVPDDLYTSCRFDIRSVEGTGIGSGVVQIVESLDGQNVEALATPITFNALGITPVQDVCIATRWIGLAVQTVDPAGDLEIGICFGINPSA